MTASRGCVWSNAAAILLVVAQLPVLWKTATDPSQSDFGNYFASALVLEKGGDVGGLYDRDAFGRAMATAGLRGLGSFVPHPPANALWLLPVATLNPPAAKALWTLILVAAIGLTALALSRLSAGFAPSVAVVLVLAPTLAVRNGLAFGQPYLILAALVVAGVVALEAGRAFLAGFLLGLGVSFKPYALVAGFLFVRRDRWRSLAGFICGALAPSLWLLSLTGLGPFTEFWSKVLPFMVRGEIQDPFSPGWGSVTALAHRLLLFERDLNPSPWMNAPLLARFTGAFGSAALLGLGVLSSRHALASGRPLDAVGACVAFALAASPFVASYHLVFLVAPVAAVAARLNARALALWALGWAALGSGLVNEFRQGAGLLAPLAYLRLFGILAVAFIVSWPFLNARMVSKAIALGLIMGVAALPWHRNEESWPRVESARGYSMVRPHFCGEALRWWSPAADGSRWETVGSGEDCVADFSRPPVAGSLAHRFEQGTVISRYAEGSWNLYLMVETPHRLETRLTFSDANEIDPVLTPDGCSVVFASDQGRGLGSSALYRLDVSALRCEREGSAPRDGRR